MSKMDRWKKISAGSKEKEQAPNKEKPELIAQLSRVQGEGEGISEEQAQEQQSEDGSKQNAIIIEETQSKDAEDGKTEEDTPAVESNGNNSTQESGVESGSKESEYTVGVESTNNTPTDNDNTPPPSPPAPPVEEEQEEEEEEPDSSGHQEVAATNSSGNTFVSRISQGIRETLDNKVTKADTHRKTSVLLKIETLDKLANYDAAMGGRIQGLFINDLLDSFFEELEQQDPKWQKILNRKVARRR